MGSRNSMVWAAMGAAATALLAVRVVPALAQLGAPRGGRRAAPRAGRGITPKPGLRQAVRQRCDWLPA